MKAGLTVVHGPFEALEEAFVAEVRRLKPGPGLPPLLIVAPSRVLADRLERLLAVERGVPLLGVHFHTFHSLAAAVVEEGGFPDAALVSDPVFHDAVVDRALDRAPSLGVARELRPKALASAVRSSLRDLIDAGVNSAQVAEHFGSTLIKDEEEAARLNALLALLALYEKELARLGVLPPSALVKFAAEAAPNSDFLSGFGGILYYGFYDLTGLQLDFFEAVTAARSSKLFFPYKVSHPAFRFSDDLFSQRLSSHALQTAEGGQAPALGESLNSLFDPSQAPVAVKPGLVSVVSASGARDEAWAAAKEVLRLLNEGIPAHEIAVVARSLEPYRPALAEAFLAENLPLDLSCGEPILRHPAAKAALDLLTLREQDFPARVIEDISNSPYFIAATPKRAWRWRRLVDALGIRAGWLQWRGKLEPKLGADVELRPHRVREGLAGELVPREEAQALWDFVAGLRETLGAAPVSWSVRAAEARKILSSHLALPEKPSAAERDAFAAVSDALDELAAFDRLGEDCSWEAFLDAFERKLVRAVRDAGDGLLGVRALDAMDARGQRFKAVVLIGLKEKMFPRQVLEDPLLRDAARAALRHPAGYWIGRKTAGHEEERLLFYLTCASAKEKLVLIYPRSDEAGKASVPSTYLRELCRAAGLPAPGEHDSRRVPRQPAERLRSTPPELLTPREAALLSVLQGGTPDAALGAADARTAPLSEELGRVAALNERGGPGPHDGLTRPIAAEMAKLKQAGLSPTALDLYATCPFRFFAARILNLGEREEASGRGELTSQERGRVYHAVLETFYASLTPLEWSGSKDWEPAYVKADAEVFARNDWRALGVYPLLWESARLDMGANLRAFIAWDLERLRAAKLQPKLYETRLQGSPEGGAPGGVPWKGVADRIDTSDASREFHVVDYKTREGKLAKKLPEKVAAGEVHQLPFYAELAGAAVGAGYKFGGASLLFLEVEDGEARSAELSAVDWGLSREAFMNILAERVEAIASGKFPIRPSEGEGKHCSWCEFPTVCRKAHGPSRARALKEAK